MDSIDAPAIAVTAPSASETPLLDKPPHGAPCNNCGLCCAYSLCFVGREILGPEAKAPCPALISNGDGRHLCGLMISPQDYRPEQAKAVGIESMQRAAQELIGAGAGCGWKYDSEPRNQHLKKSGLTKLSNKEVIKLLQVWGISRRRSIAFLQKRAPELAEMKAAYKPAVERSHVG